MRRVPFVVLAAALAACGKSSSESAPPPASGTIMGSPFTPADSGALVTASPSCNFGLGPRSISVLAVGFSSFANVCGFAQTAGLCGDVASSTIVTASIINSPATGTAPPVGPGTYPIGQHIIGSDIVVTGVTIAKVGAACAPATGIPTATSGSITISATSPRVTGSLDVTFSDGSRFSGPFDLGLCTASVDFCSLVTGSCTTPVCCSAPTSCP